MRTCLASLLGLTLLLVVSSSAHAQRAYDITNCGANTDTVVRVVDAAVRRLNQVERASPQVFRQNLVKAFGDYSQDTEVSGWGGAIYLGNFLNTRVLLAGGTPVNVLGGPVPVLPRLVFNCVTGRAVDIARFEGNGRVDLFVELFFSLPESRSNGSDSQVGTVLHEAIHVLGGPRDIIVDRANQDVSAALLASRNDPRTFTNAQNYEMFWMSFLQ